MRELMEFRALMVCCLAGTFLGVGCHHDADQPAGGTGAAAPAEQSALEHEHGGWWCAEHGIPEEECSLCSSTAAAQFQEAGDWCEEHQRAKSQCFVCTPTAQEKYADLYRSRYGEDPPAIE